MSDPPAQPRRSLGGRAIEDSLLAAGFALSAPGVALVETVRPQRSAYDVVLAQNAWNVLPWGEFRRLQRPYPVAMRRRALLRRAVSTVNLRRAGTVVCLTDYMGELCRAAGARRVVVSPVTVPYGLRPPSVTEEVGPPAALVPGTVTWYKGTVSAVELVADLVARGDLAPGTPLILAGPDDASGCLQAALAQAAALELSCSHHILARDELLEAFSRASVVVLASELESLGLPIAEALLCGASVLATPIAPHRELAARVGGAVNWVGEPRSGNPARQIVVDHDADWLRLGEVLGLPLADRRTGVEDGPSARAGG